MRNLNSILLIDDDESSNFLHSIFINKLDIDLNVNSALNGQEGIDFILGKGQDKLELPCMVMLDLRMPVMDGWQFMNAYEQQVPEGIKQQITIVLVTISDNQEDKDKAVMNKYIADFAQKPLSDANFQDLIKKHYALEVI